MKIGGAEMAAVGALDEGRAPGAGIIAGPAALDLNHVGAEIGQNLAGPRPGQNPGKLEDTQSGQWTRHEMNSRQRRGRTAARRLTDPAARLCPGRRRSPPIKTAFSAPLQRKE